MLLYPPHTPVFLCKSAQTIDFTELTISLFARECRKSAQVIDYLKLSPGEALTKVVTLQSGQNCLRTHYITPVKPKVGASRRPPRILSLASCVRAFSALLACE